MVWMIKDLARKTQSSRIKQETNWRCLDFKFGIKWKIQFENAWRGKNERIVDDDSSVPSLGTFKMALTRMICSNIERKTTNTKKLIRLASFSYIGRSKKEMKIKKNKKWKKPHTQCLTYKWKTVLNRVSYTYEIENSSFSKLKH